MMSYWSSFATNSTPTSLPPCPIWPPYNIIQKSKINFIDGNMILIQNGYNDNLCQFWDLITH